MADEQPFRSTATPTQLRHILPLDLNDNNDGNARDPPFKLLRRLQPGLCDATAPAWDANVPREAVWAARLMDPKR